MPENNSQPAWLTEATDMVTLVESYITPATKATIQQRLYAWQQQEKVSGVKKNLSTTTLPLLVMRSRGLPQTLDPFYFSLS